MPKEGSAMKSLSLAVLVSTLQFSVSAEAHSLDTGGGLTMGLLHPLSGIDHMLAILICGIWIAQIGGRMLWRGPLIFVAMLTFGGLMALAGLGLPLVETGLAVSIIFLGFMVLNVARIPSIVGWVLVSTIAIVHGYAHLTELSHTASVTPFLLGFSMTSLIMLLIGIGLGSAFIINSGRYTLPRAGGL